MTGLKRYERDLLLPESVGGRSVLRDADDLVARVQAHLAPEGVQVAGASCVWARWKPGVALATCWQVELSDGHSAWVTHKAYAGSKATHLSEHYRLDEHAESAAAPLRPFVILPEEGAFLAAFPVDRELRGAGRLMNLRRTARHLDAAGVWEGWVLRLRASSLEPVRYKPERRAVFRLDARLRDEVGGRAQRVLGARVLPPAEAARVAEVRRSLPLEGVPRLLAHDAEAGILFEEWLEGEAPAAGADVDRAAGRLLAQVHGHGASGALLQSSGDQDLLASFPEWAGRVPVLASDARQHATCWVHGDAHRDQLLCNDGELTLLDLDTLRPGRPEEDLASWIAIRMAADDCSWASASEELLVGHGEAGGVHDPRALRVEVARQLVGQAAGAIRRLERDAKARVGHLLERSMAVANGDLS